jgi:hypothetical protein
MGRFVFFQRPLPSKGVTEQLTCRASRPAGTLPTTPQEPCSRYTDRQSNPCNTNISPGKDLSPLSLAVGIWLGRRSFATGWFDIESNSCSDSLSDLPSDFLTESLTCRVTLLAVTHSLSDSPKALSLGASS